MSRDQRPANRMETSTYDYRMAVGEGFHDIAISVSTDKSGKVQKVMFPTRGKIGHGMDHMLSDLGIAVSRAIQGRDPQTGDPL